jgi:antagonist of KipI
MEVSVIRSGMLTTVQDLGRRGHLAEGVPNGGAADPFAMRVANMLVGNPDDAPGLEITLTGPELEFSEATWVSVCGARFEGVPAWRPIHVEAGGRIKFGRRLAGCRAYLSLSGGFEIEPVLGGRGTYLAAGLGGFNGRALQNGDILRTAPHGRVPTGHWSIDERILPHYSAEPSARVMPGLHSGEFGDGIGSARFSVAAESDRMGMRLSGHKLVRSGTGDLVSAAVAPGTVQVPPDGNPIVLLADAQTLGGYPRVAQVITVDMPLVAQLAPGDALRFVSSTLADAHALIHAREHDLGLLRQGLEEKMRPS